MPAGLHPADSLNHLTTDLGIPVIRSGRVLLCARLSRPAGPVLRDGSRLIRPVQSCLGGYGQFLRFTEITQLDDQGFRQR